MKLEYLEVKDFIGEIYWIERFNRKVIRYISNPKTCIAEKHFFEKFLDYTIIKNITRKDFIMTW